MIADSRDSPDAARPAPGRLGRGLLAGAVAALVVAGLLLWWRQGDAVFSQYLLGALAWCF